MDSLKKMQTEILLRNGYLKKEKISEKEYNELLKDSPDTVLKKEEYDHITGKLLDVNYFRVVNVQDYDDNNIPLLCMLERNKLITQIENHVKQMKNIMLFGFIAGIVGGIFLILSSLAH